MATAQPILRILNSTRVGATHAEAIQNGAVPGRELEIVMIAVALGIGPVTTRAAGPGAVGHQAEIAICHWNLSNQSPRICRAPKYGTASS